MKYLYLATCAILITNCITCEIWKHHCVLHHAAFYEVNSWGLSSFKWEDDSYAHTPFQNWDDIQTQIFKNKLDKLGVPK